MGKWSFNFLGRNIAFVALPLGRADCCEPCEMPAETPKDG